MDNHDPKGQSWPRKFLDFLRSERGEVGAPAAAPEAPAAASGSASPASSGGSGTPGATPAAPPAAPAVKTWYEGLPDDFKNNPSVQKFKEPQDMVKSYLELQSLLGHDKVPLPKDENDKVAIAHLNKALGVPEAPEGYELQAPAPMKGFEQVQFGMDEFKAMAHKRNLTPQQAAGVLEDYTSILASIKAKSEADFVKAVQETKGELVKEWGLTYDQKVGVAQSLMNKFAKDKETFDYINAMVGEDPVMLKFFADVGDSFSEGSLGTTGQPGSRFTKTPAEAKAEYDKIMSDPEDIYWAGVRNKKMIPESLRKERITYVESLLKMHLGQPAAK